MKKLLFLLLTITIATSASAQTLTGSWSGKLKVGMAELTLVFHIDGTKVTMDSPDQGAKAIPTTVNVLTDDSLDVDIVQLGVNYAARLQEGQLKGTFKQNGMTFPLTLSAGEKKANRPQTPRKPYPYATEEVVVSTRSGARLAGTVAQPFLMKRGETPIVLMLTGSGPQDRDETLFEHRPFLIIADVLARYGIATMRFDDRGMGESTLGDATKMTTKDLAEDAEDVLAYLRSLNKYGKVGVLGHSEGASIAFMLGGKGLTDFIVSLAGCGVKGDTALTTQANRLLELSGQPVRMTKDEYVAQPAVQQNPWLKAFVDYDPTADMQKITCPVFALNGTKDTQVLCGLNLPAIDRAIQSEKIIKAYEGLNHLFQHCTTGLPTEYGQIEETISAEVLKDIADWLSAF